jgi:adenosylmethionine-8-amino-7-oxononanoate aminotransferase
LPLAATLATEEIYEAFLGPYSEYKTFFHGHSYTGNALACAAACANLEIFESEKVIEKAQEKIALLKNYLAREIEPLPHVGDVRQCGLMVGIELVESRSLRTAYPPDLRIGAQVTQDVRRHGVILRPLGDVIVLMPPLSITPEEIELLISATVKSINNICGDN